MSSTHRRVTGVVRIAVGALFAPAAIALLTGPLASADTPDDLTTIGPYTFDGYTDTFTYDTDTYAFDNYLVGSYDSYPYDLDVYSGAPGSNTAEVLFTVPLLFQGGFDDVDGTITPLYSFNAADFSVPDIGLVDLGGAVGSGQDIVTVGPFTLDGYTDTFSFDTETSAFDNYLIGSLDSLDRKSVV